MLCSLPLFALAPPLPAVAVAGAYGIGLAGISYGTALWETTLQTRIPQEVLSRVSSYDWLISLVFMPIGFVAFGPLADAIGIGTTLVLPASVLATANLLVALMPAVRAIRRPVAGTTTAAAPAGRRATA